LKNRYDGIKDGLHNVLGNYTVNSETSLFSLILMVELASNEISQLKLTQSQLIEALYTLFERVDPDKLDVIYVKVQGLWTTVD